MSHVELHVPARPEYLSLVRAVVAAAADLEPMRRNERVDDLRLIVSEATTNAMEAHTRVDSDERVLIRLDLGEDRIEVEVTDRGAGFEPEDLETLPHVSSPDRLDFERGLGIPLMRVLADHHEIRSSEKGTAVRLVVYTSRHRPEPSTIVDG